MLSPSTRYGSVPRLDVRGVSVRFGGNMALDDASLSPDKEDPAERTDAIIGRIGLRATADVRVTSLPTGQGRLVELGRALACNPRVLLLDEPASGQDDSETEQFSRLLRELADEGVAVVLVEHDVQLVMSVCDV